MLSVNLTVERQNVTGLGFSLVIEFCVGAGVTALFGPSGAGKSTILQAIAGLLRPTAGRISLDQEVLFDSQTGIDLPLRERRVGYVFQDLALFPHLSALSNVAYGLQKLPRRERQVRALEILRRFELAAVITRRPSDLSGGQQQRVALARALVIEPRILLLDEPLSALDAATKRELIEDLRGVARDSQIPILYVTHAREEVLALAARVLVLDQGRIVAQGEPLNVLENVSAPTLARLSGVENSFEGEIVAKHPDRGTMTCRIADCQLEILYTAHEVGQIISVAIRAGDILLATQEPVGLSARNHLRGQVVQLTPRGYDLLVQVECGRGTVFSALITREAQRELNVRLGQEIWLVIKTHACYIVSSDM
jgi:molybdate transport system ATP-binding protein